MKLLAGSREIPNLSSAFQGRGWGVGGICGFRVLDLILGFWGVGLGGWGVGGSLGFGV